MAHLCKRLKRFSQHQNRTTHISCSPATFSRPGIASLQVFKADFGTVYFTEHYLLKFMNRVADNGENRGWNVF